MVHSAHSVALLLSSFDVALPSKREKHRLNSRDFPLHTLSFAGSVDAVPRAQVAFSNEPSRNLLCVTILDIMSTSCACAFTSVRAFSATRCCARQRARRRRSPNTLTAREPMGLSFRNCMFEVDGPSLDSLGAGGRNLALNSRSSLLILQFLVQQRHFMSSIEQVPVIPRADSSCTSHPLSGPLKGTTKRGARSKDSSKKNHE